MNFMVAIFAGLGIGAWVYSKVMRSTGNNTQNALIVAGMTGGLAFIIMLMIMNMIPN